MRSIFGLAGANPLLRAIFSFQHHTSTSTPYPSFHRSLQTPTPATSLSDRYRARCALAGQSHQSCAITFSCHLTSTNTPYPSPHRSLQSSTPASSIPDRYRVRCARFSVWRGKTPTPSRSHILCTAPPQPPKLHRLSCPQDHPRQVSTTPYCYRVRHT
jgi:hypothetical protein